MKLLPLKYLPVIIILLFSIDICDGSSIHCIKGLKESILEESTGNHQTEKDCLNLEQREGESGPANHGQRVETIVISCPLSIYSDLSFLNILTLQKIAISKTEYFCIFSFSFFCSTNTSYKSFGQYPPDLIISPKIILQTTCCRCI
jgi:hypothetical protein